MYNFRIREVLNSAMDFFKMHYEYLLPFSFLFFVFSLLFGFVKNEFTLLLFILVLPLTISIPYFAHKLQRGGESRRLGLFFEVYSSTFKFYGVMGLKIISMLILLSPMLYLMSDVMAKFNFDENQLKLAIENGEFIPSKNLSITTFISILLVILSYPFFFFAEYFAVIGNESVIDSFKKSYALGYSNYSKLFALMIIHFFVMAVGSLLTCGFIFLLAFPLFNLIYYFIYKECQENL